MLVLPAVLQDSDFQHCALIAVCCDQLGAVMAYFETLLKNKKKKQKTTKNEVYYYSHTICNTYILFTCFRN